MRACALVEFSFSLACALVEADLRSWVFSFCLALALSLIDT